MIFLELVTSDGPLQILNLDQMKGFTVVPMETSAGHTHVYFLKELGKRGIDGHIFAKGTEDQMKDLARNIAFVCAKGEGFYRASFLTSTKWQVVEVETL